MSEGFLGETLGTLYCVISEEEEEVEEAEEEEEEEEA